MCAWYDSTVLTLRCNSSAIWRVPWPSPIRRNTSSSRSVSLRSATLRVAGLLTNLLQHPLGHAVAHIDLAAQNAAHRHQHALGRLLLHDVAVGAGPQRALRVERLVVHGKHQHRQRRRRSCGCS